MPGLFSKLLSKPLSQSATQELVDWELLRLKESGSPSEIWLFGSASRMQMTSASDLDFVLIYNTQSELKEGRAAYHSSKRKHKCGVDVLFTTKLEFEEKAAIGGVYFVCKKEGSLIYRDES